MRLIWGTANIGQSTSRISQQFLQNLNVKKTNTKPIYLPNLNPYKMFLLLLSEATVQLEQNYESICENWTHSKELTNV